MGFTTGSDLASRRSFRARLLSRDYGLVRGLLGAVRASGRTALAYFRLHPLGFVPMVHFVCGVAARNDGFSLAVDHVHDESARVVVKPLLHYGGCRAAV